MPTHDANPDHAPLARATHGSLSCFGSAPAHSAKAPGRINLIGEHTDYNGGLVLPTPISLLCAAVGGIAKNSESHLFAADINKTFTFDHTQDLSSYLDSPTGIPRGHWASYILGVLHGYREAGFDLPALDIAVASDIPIGAGLSSSAALEAATANLIESITGRAIPLLDKARLCRTAEHTFAGVPCGIMDQYAVILGRPGQALLIDCATEESTLVPLPPRDRAAILIIDTQVRHKLADGQYAQRRRTCDSAAAKLGVATLSSANIDALSRTLLTDDEFRCATHVLLENARVRLAVEALHSEDLARLGQLMYESHASLRYDYRVSCPELDTIVDLACAIPAIFGARMTGAGFGGCVIAIVNPAALEEASQRITDGFAKAHGRACRTLAATD